MGFLRAFHVAACVLTLLIVVPGQFILPANGFAAETAIEEVMRAERIRLGKLCKTIRFSSDYLTLIDYNNDKLPDVVTNPGGVTCDGVRVPECSVLGCMTRFYTQLKDGGYHLTAEMQLYDWHMRLRYGNMVFVMTMQGGMCKRAAVDVCTVEYRVRELRFVELKRE